MLYFYGYSGAKAVENFVFLINFHLFVLSLQANHKRLTLKPDEGCITFTLRIRVSYFADKRKIVYFYVESKKGRKYDGTV